MDGVRVTIVQDSSNKLLQCGTTSSFPRSPFSKSSWTNILKLWQFWNGGKEEDECLVFIDNSPNLSINGGNSNANAIVHNIVLTQLGVTIPVRHRQ